MWWRYKFVKCVTDSWKFAFCQMMIDKYGPDPRVELRDWLTMQTLGSFESLIRSKNRPLG